MKAAPLLAALAPAAQAQAPVPVAPGDTLDSPGHYAVTEAHSVDGRLFPDNRLRRRAARRRPRRHRPELGQHPRSWSTAPRPE